MNYVWVATSIVKLVSHLHFHWNYAAIGLSVVIGGIATQMLLRVFKRMELIVTFCFLAAISFFVDAAINSTEGQCQHLQHTQSSSSTSFSSPGAYGHLLTESPSYQARGFFYCLSTALSLSSLAIIRMQSAEIRGEECQ
jgi:hypothetical protein